MTDSKPMSAMFDAFDNANQGLAVWDDRDNLIGFNSIYKDIFKSNMHIEPKIGINFGEAYNEASKKTEFQLNPENNKLRFAIRHQARKDKKPIESEFKLESGIWLNVKETASNDGHMITVITNITESKNSADMQNRLSSAIDSIPSHVMFWDQDEKLIKANELAIKENLNDGIMLEEGMSYSEFLRTQFEKNLYSTPKDFSLDRFVEKRLTERKELTSKSTKVRYKNGKTVIRTENKLDDGGILTILNDVSELEERENQEKLLSHSLDNISYGIKLWDKNKKLIRSNSYIKALNKTFNISEEIGTSWEESMKSYVQNDFYEIPKNETKESWTRKGIDYFYSFEGEKTTTYKMSNGSYMMVTEKKLDDENILQVMSDVTHLKSKEKDLERLQDAIDQMPTGMALWDSDDKLVYFNKLVEEFNSQLGFEIKPGISRLDMLQVQFDNGTNDKRYKTPQDFHNEYKKTMDESPEGIKIEITSNLKGESLNFINSGLRLDSGDWIQIFSDITEQKKRELDLKRLYEAIDKMSGGIIVWDKNHKLIFANKEMRDNPFGFEFKQGVSRLDMLEHQQKLGYSPIPKGKSIEDWVKQSYDSIREKKEGVTTEIKVKDEYMLNSQILLEDESYIQSYTYITELKNQQKDLERLSDAVDAMSSGVIVWDQDQNLFFANEAAKRVQHNLGYDLVKGCSRYEMFKNTVDKGAYSLPNGASIQDYLNKTVDMLREKKEGYSREMIIDGRDWLSTNVGLEDGSFIQSYTDISEIKEQQSELDRIKRGIDEFKSTAVAIWSNEDKLVFANEFFRDFAKKIDFDMVPGINRIDFLKQQFSRGAITTEEKSPEAYAKRLNYEMDNNPDGARFEFAFKGDEGERHALQSAVRVESGDWIQIITDITLIKSQQIELERLSDGIQKLVNPIIIWDSDNKVFFCNQAAVDVQKHWNFELKPGVEREAMLSNLADKGILDLPDGMTLKEFIGFQKGRMTESKEGITVESKAGEMIYLATSRLLDDGSFIQNYTDISEIKKHEELIENQRERFDRVLGDLESIVFESDLENDTVTYEIPSALKDFWGESSTSGTRDEGYKNLREDFLEPYKNAFRDHITGKTQEVSVEHVNVHQGKEIWYQTRAKATFENGRAVKMTGIVENIDKRKALEVKVKEAQQLVADAVDNIEAGIILWDNFDNAVLINKYIKKLVGKDLNIGSSYRELSKTFIESGIFDTKGMDIDEYIEGRIKARSEIKESAISLLPPMADGRTIQMTSKRLPDNSLIQVYYDISDLKQRE
ncbi:MAG: hypothetical protein CML38_10425, partial [Rhodobacteraceae bacterium]